MPEELTPVTRLEGFLTGDDQLTPVTRLEKILAGEDVTPVTRLEKFLQMAGGGGGGLEMESGTFVPVSDIVHPTITFSNSHDRSPDFYFIVDTKTDPQVTPESSSVLWTAYVCWENIVNPVYEGANPVYGFNFGVYWYSGSASNASRRFNHTTSEEPVGADSVYYPQYYATAESIKPFASDTRKFKTTKSYDWYAYWLN